MDQITMTEGFKAIQEVSKLGVEVLKSSGDLIKWAGGLLGLKDGEILGLVSDKLQFFRWERQVRMATEYNKKSIGQPKQPIEPKFLIPILENGSLEENDDIQNLWVNLLVSWTRKEDIEKRKMTYIDILKNLSMQDVKILDKVYKLSQKVNSEITYCGYGEDIDNIKDYRRILIKRSDIDYKLHDIIYYESVDNLIRLGCLRIAETHGKSPDILNLTYLGAGLVEACIVD